MYIGINTILREGQELFGNLKFYCFISPSDWHPFNPDVGRNALSTAFSAAEFLGLRGAFSRARSLEDTRRRRERRPRTDLV